MYGWPVSYIQSQGSSYNDQMSNRFYVLSEQCDFTRKNFQRHVQLQHHGNYMAGSAEKYTSRKGQIHKRQSQAKHVSTKTKIV